MFLRWTIEAAMLLVVRGEHPAPGHLVQPEPLLDEARIPELVLFFKAFEEPKIICELDGARHAEAQLYPPQHLINAVDLARQFARWPHREQRAVLA
jgi:hypothetical protein